MSPTNYNVYIRSRDENSFFATSLRATYSTSGKRLYGGVLIFWKDTPSSRVARIEASLTFQNIKNSLYERVVNFLDNAQIIPETFSVHSASPCFIMWALIIEGLCHNVNMVYLHTLPHSMSVSSKRPIMKSPSNIKKLGHYTSIEIRLDLTLTQKKEAKSDYVICGRLLSRRYLTASFFVFSCKKW